MSWEPWGAACPSTWLLQPREAGASGTASVSLMGGPGRWRLHWALALFSRAAPSGMSRPWEREIQGKETRSLSRGLAGGSASGKATRPLSDPVPLGRLWDCREDGVQVWTGETSWGHGQRWSELLLG